MKGRAVVFIIFVLLLIQAFFFASVQKDGIQAVDREMASLRQRVSQLKAEKADLIRQVQELKHIPDRLPAVVTHGFDDPEQGFVEFLDYLDNPMMQTMGAKVKINQAQKFQQNPVALHESIFGIEFRFLDTFEAEALFHYLLQQDRFPVRINGVQLRRAEGEPSQGEMSISLLTPAKMDIPVIQKRSEG